MIMLGSKLYRLCSLFALLMMTLIMRAQTIEWQLKPTADYDEIIPVGKNLFKVVSGGKIGLINSDGTIVELMDNDALTLFYEDKALLTKSDAHGERISGVLMSDGTYHKFNKKYYVLAGQNFFSDGLLSVEDENSNKGYINYLGTAVLCFDGRYTRIKPFVNGYAAVFKGGGKYREYLLINKDGEVTIFRNRSGILGKLTSGSNVHPDGNVYVFDGENEKWYSYDTNKRGFMQKSSIKDTTPYDYLYRFSKITGKSKIVPFKDIPYNGVKGIEPFNDGGNYGYKSEDGIIIVHAQLSRATQFIDNYAVVEINGRKGILKYIDSGTFEVSAINGKQNFYTGEELSCSFNFRVPPIWRGGGAIVRLLDDTGTAVEYTHEGDTYTFKVKPSKTGTKSYQLRVRSEGLLLYESQLNYQFTKKTRCIECGKDTDACEYHGKHPSVIKPTKKSSENKCPTCDCKYYGKHPFEDKSSSSSSDEKCPTCGCMWFGQH